MAVTPDLLMKAMGITQVFGPQRALPREERLRKAAPSAGEPDLQQALAECDRVEARALHLAEAVREKTMSFGDAAQVLSRQFPWLPESQASRAMNQAMWFAAK